MAEEKEKDYKDRAAEESARATAEYEKRYNPSAAAVDAYKRAMTTQLRENYGQQRETERSYSDLYQQARRQATRQGAMSNISGFGGGRARGQEARISAAEIQALSGIAGQRESALRQLAEQRQAISSNALIEAQQADQYDRAMRAANLSETNQILELIGNVEDFSKFNNRQKAQLKQYNITSQEDLNKFLGINPSAVEAQNQPRISTAMEAYLDFTRLLPGGELLDPRTYTNIYDLFTGKKRGTTAEAAGLTAENSVGDYLGAYLGLRDPIED
jgi:hypothetical protein